MKAIVFAPHPDDEIIGCGGILLKNNWEKTIVYVTSGEFCENKNDKTGYRTPREKEAREVCRIIGANPLFLREPDRFLQNSERTVELVLAVLAKENPDIVFVPHGHEQHGDHKTVNQIVLKSCWLYQNLLPAGSGKNRPKLFLYEVWTQNDNFNLAEDISKVMRKKLRLIRKYKSQKNLGLAAMARALNGCRGARQKKGGFCEHFEVLSLNTAADRGWGTKTGLASSGREIREEG